MYICICNAITDHDVRCAAEAGARRPREVYQARGCEAKCGTCTGGILCLLRECLVAREHPVAIARS